MKKISIILFIFLLSSLASPKNILKIGAYAGYFSPKDDSLNSIYKKKDPIYGGKVGVRVWNEFYVWVSGMHCQKKGKTSLLDDDTQLTLNPVTLSLKYTAPLGSFKPYVGAGITYLYYKEKSNIGDVKGEQKGYTVEAGFELNLSRHFALDLGASYSDIKVDPTGFDVELGGFQAGISFLILI